MDFLIEEIQRENDESMRMLRVVVEQCGFCIVSFAI